MAAIFAHHENIGRGGFDRTSELLRGVRRFGGRGKSEREKVGQKCGRCISVPGVVRPYVGGVLFRGGGGGRVDRRRSGVSEVRRHGHGAVIGHGQATKKCGGGSNIRHRENHLPLGAGADLGDGGFAAAVRGGAGRTGLRSVSPRAVSPGAPVAGALVPLAAVSPVSSPVSPRCRQGSISTLPAAGPAVMAGRVPSPARAPAVPVISATVGAVAGPKAIGDSQVSVPWESVRPVVRGGVEGGVGLPRALSGVRERWCRGPPGACSERCTLPD